MYSRQLISDPFSHDLVSRQANGSGVPAHFVTSHASLIKTLLYIRVMPRLLIVVAVIRPF